MLEAGQEWMDVETGRVAHITYVDSNHVIFYVGNEFYDWDFEAFCIIYTRERYGEISEDDIDYHYRKYYGFGPP